LETARRDRHNNWGHYAGINWIIPQQPFGPSYATFAAHIANTGNLLIWSHNIQRIDIGNIEIIKCNGPHKNHSGLAVVVNSDDNALGKTLLPGDAAYQYILREDILLNGLVATHHGAQFPINNAPVPNTQNGCIAYSFGITNYGHPHVDAVNAYVQNGWGTIPGDRLRTHQDGHISFRRPPPLNVHHNCGNPNCDLANVFYF
jgi:hypothetical protein